MGHPVDEPILPKPEPDLRPAPETIQERRRRMAALAAETQAIIETDRLARDAEAPAAWLYLNALIKAHPALAAACQARRVQMAVAGIGEDYLLEELLSLARDYRPQADKWSAPMNLSETLATIAKS